jgi:hypothetical protein
MFDSDWQERQKRRAKPACRACQLSRIGRGTAVPHIFSLTYGGGTCQGVIQTIPENLWSLAPHGLERCGGWKRAPQATAIHRMEGETGGERVKLQFLNEYAECPERCLGASVVRAMAIWGEYAVDSNWGDCGGSYIPTHTPQTLTQ